MIQVDCTRDHREANVIWEGHRDIGFVDCVAVVKVPGGLAPKGSKELHGVFVLGVNGLRSRIT